MRLGQRGGPAQGNAARRRNHLDRSQVLELAFDSLTDNDAARERVEQIARLRQRPLESVDEDPRAARRRNDYLDFASDSRTNRLRRRFGAFCDSTSDADAHDRPHGTVGIRKV